MVLDIGAAAGFFLSGLLDCGWSGDGLEPNAAMSDYGKNKLGANVVNGTLERLPQELRVRQYDLSRWFKSCRIFMTFIARWKRRHR